MHQARSLERGGHTDHSGRESRLGKAPREVVKPVVPWGVEGSLKRETGAGAVARKDVGLVIEAERVEQVEAVENIVHVLRVYALAGGIRMAGLDGVVGEAGMRGILGQSVVN
jgi:hypothetical protein